MTHFEIGPGNDEPNVKWWMTSRGVWGCEVGQYEKVRIVLVNGEGLPVRSNNLSVVPNDEAAFKGTFGFDQRRVIEFRTLSVGTALIEVREGGLESYAADGKPITSLGNLATDFQVKVTPQPRVMPTLVRLDPPQTALNAPNVRPYRMTFTHEIPWSSSAEEVLAKVHPSSLHLAISAHGDPGIISLGRGFSMRNVDAFKVLADTAPRLRIIWAGACAIAGPPGIDFCRTMARNAYAYLVAAGMTVVESHQLTDGVAEWIGPSLPHFFDPDGNLMTEPEFTKLQFTLGFTILPY